MIHPAGSLFEGRLTFRWGYGVVLTEITRLKFEASGLGEILPPHLVICKDEMTESADAEGFQSRGSHKSIIRSSFASGMPARMPARIFSSRRFAGPSLQV